MSSTADGDDDKRAAAVDALLDAALTRLPAERAAWLRARAAEHPALAADLAPLVAELEACDDFLSPGGAAHGPLFDDLCERLGEAAEPPSLPVGHRVGSYEVVAAIGRGGMGEVYRARDRNLGRDVALKVLPPALRKDARTVARLRREARVLAALNHPNIASIYELEEDGSAAALVLELVPGVSLADRLANGPMPLNEIESVARQLVDALAASRARGVVHRDLKPANISISVDGRVKVLDFGIATVLRDRDDAIIKDAPSVPTLELPPGAAVGTAAYMSPEQVRAEPVDHRTDVWAFGCVLFEMLTGRRAFDGRTTTEVFAQVLEGSPDLGALPSWTPRGLRELVARCLEKAPARRLEDISDARRLLARSSKSGTAPGSSRTGRRSLARAWPMLAGLAVGVVVSPLLLWMLASKAPAPVARLTVPLPATDELVAGAHPSLAISPDGRTFVYSATRDGVLRLFRRALEDAAPASIADSVDATGPFISPDGQWVGFDRDGFLVKVPLEGGPGVQICRADSGGSASSWSDRDEIIFASASGRGLFVVPASGGVPQRLTRIDQSRGEQDHGSPHALPGGSAVLFTITGRDGASIAAVRRDTGSVDVLTAGRQPQYVSSGHVLFVRDDALWAAPFDARELQLTGDPVPVLRGLDTVPAAHYVAASDGSLLYVPQLDQGPLRHLVWMDRAGREAPTGADARRYSRHSLSPDGTRVALVIADADGQDLWVHDLQRGTLARVAFDPDPGITPLWTRDGRAIVFRSDRQGAGLFRVPADGSAAPVRLTPSDGRLHAPHAFTPDGRGLVLTEFRSYRAPGIGVLDTESGRLQMIIDEEAAELAPALSPDGRFIAYQSDASGRFEVYVRSYPDVGARRWQLSTGGGTLPQWSPGGRELFYLDPHALVSVPLSAGEDPFAIAPRRLFDASAFAGRLGPVYSVSPDGQRFLVLRDAPGTDRLNSRRTLLLVQHWTRELEAKLQGRR